MQNEPNQKLHVFAFKSGFMFFIVINNFLLFYCYNLRVNYKILLLHFIQILSMGMMTEYYHYFFTTLVRKTPLFSNPQKTFIKT